MDRALEKSSGVVVGGERIKSIKYGDDEAAMAEGDLQVMMEKI